MLPRRRIASVSSRALTDLSVGTSPQMTSRILLPEPPKNSPTVPPTDAPGCLNGTILTKTASGALNMLLAPGGCNIVFSREGVAIHAEEIAVLLAESAGLVPPRL